MAETLIPISQDALASLLGDTIKKSPEEIGRLKRLLQTMSPGNPNVPRIQSMLLDRFGITEERVADLHGTVKADDALW